jgi:hypothetical protein
MLGFLDKVQARAFKSMSRNANEAQLSNNSISSFPYI